MTSHSAAPVAPKRTGLHLNAPIISLLLALAAFSVTGVVLKQTLNAGAPPTLIVFFRLTLSTLLLTPFILRRYRAEISQLSRPIVALVALGGVCVALHFTLINVSLNYTSVMLNQVIVNTGPIWIGLMEVGFLKVRFSKWVWIGVVVVMLGGATIAASGLLESGGTNIGSNPALGNLLALGAAILGSVYTVIGRGARGKMSFIPYLWIAYGAGAITGLVACLITHTPVVGYSPDVYFWLLMVTIIPQLIGHSSMNFALGHFPATFISLTNQIVSVSAGILGFLLFAEVPGLLDIIGSAIIIGGVAVAITQRPTPNTPAEVAAAGD